jgi:hypothetical protein
LSQIEGPNSYKMSKAHSHGKVNERETVQTSDLPLQMHSAFGIDR